MYHLSIWIGPVLEKEQHAYRIQLPCRKSQEGVTLEVGIARSHSSLVENT
jgi:hypothetical protein